MIDWVRSNWWIIPVAVGIIGIAIGYGRRVLGWLSPSAKLGTRRPPIPAPVSARVRERIREEADARLVEINERYKEDIERWEKKFGKQSQ